MVVVSICVGGNVFPYDRGPAHKIWSWNDNYNAHCYSRREKMEEISSLVQGQENSGKIQILLGDIKNLAIGVGGSLIASGILSALQKIM